MILCAAQMLCTTTSLCEQEAKHCVQEALGLAVEYLKNVVCNICSSAAFGYYTDACQRGFNGITVSFYSAFGAHYLAILSTSRFDAIICLFFFFFVAIVFKLWVFQS